MDLPREHRFAFAAFTFDASTGDLRRNGRKLRISEQASRILTALLNEGGNLVSREDLRRMLWPEGEFVDYDHSINKVVCQLRATLRDDPRTPRFIETVAKRGYRFLAKIEVLPAESSAQHANVAAVENAFATLPAVQAEERDSPSAFQNSPGTPGAGAGTRAWLTRSRLAGGIALLLLVLTGIALAYYVRKSHSQYVLMGVAPFEVSGSEAESLAESFRLDLMDAISELPSVQVRAAHSFTNAKYDDNGIRTLARSLRLDALLLGKFSTQNGQCTLKFELVHGPDAVHIASFQYSGSQTDLASIRDRIQRDIFARLNLMKKGDLHPYGSTGNPHAYEAYLRGRFFFSQRSVDSLERALTEFQSAIDQDPAFAKAYAGMARTHGALAEESVSGYREHYNRGKEFATKALQLDNSLAEAHAVLGYLAYRADWDFQLGENQMRRAIELEPNNAFNHIVLSILLCSEGRFDECSQQVETARTIDPLWPSVYVAAVHMATNSRQNKKAIAAAEELVGLAPNLGMAQNSLAWAYWDAGRYADAIAAWRAMALLEKDEARLQLENRGMEAFRHGGVRAYARVRLEAARSGRNWLHQNDFYPPEWYFYAGEREQALAELVKTVDARHPSALELTLGPPFDSFHQDPRFLALLRRMGLSLPRYPKE